MNWIESAGGKYYANVDNAIDKNVKMIQITDFGMLGTDIVLSAGAGYNKPYIMTNSTDFNEDAMVILSYLY